MEVLRPSTPMPLGKAPTRYECYQMKKRSSDSLPPLQPLVEENNSRRPYGRKNQVCQAARLQSKRHIVKTREGESVEIIDLSASKTTAEFCQEDRSKTVLPELNSERLLAGREDSDSLLITSRMEFQYAKGTNGVSPVRAQGVNQKGKNSGPKTDFSSQSSNSAGLPTVARNAKNNLNMSSNTTALQKHIEQQEKEYDSASIKADIFQRWLQSQQK